MSQRGFEILTCSAAGPEIDDITNEGVSHVIIPFTRRITLFRDVVCLLLLIRLMIRFRPHIVHTHTPKAGLLGMMAAWICRVPVRMHTVAGLPVMVSKGLKATTLRITERITCFCAQRVYPNSVGLKEYMQHQMKIDARKLSVLANGSSNGIDTVYFQKTATLAEEGYAIRRRYQIGSNAIVFSFLGRLVKDKGIVELISAFCRMQGMDAYLLLVGSFEGDLDPLPPATLQLINDNPRIIQAGFQRDVRPWLLAADVFVFPSYREGFPNVVLQAAALEVASIVSDINGCNEIVQNGKTGLLVKPREENELFDAMQYLAQNEGIRKEYGKHSREFVTKNFEQRYFWEELLHEYQVLMKRNVV